MTVTGAVTFDNDNNRLILEDEILTMGSSATFVSADNNEFVVTNNTGTVTKQSLGSTSFTYEVGFGTGEYTPLSISNSGTNDISVRCLQHVLDQGTAGSLVTNDFADNSWVVAAVGSGYNLQLIAGWAASDELSNFNRVKTGIARYTAGFDWDLPASNVVAASGSGPYTRNRSGITSVGVFAVADLEKVNTARLNLKAFLQGPYLGGTMTDALRANNVIPLTQPYSSAMSTTFDRVGVYDGSVTVNEHVTGAGVFDVTGTDNDIIDWVYVSLQDGTTPATKLQTRAALIQRDGDIVEYDSASTSYTSVRMPIDADGNYHLIVAHRNHLAIRTPVSQLLEEINPFTYNFTDAQAKAYQNPNAPVSNNTAMKDLGGSVFAMWAGNVYNLNTIVNYTGLNADAVELLGLLLADQSGNIGGAPLNLRTYNRGDLNMNGIVNYTGLNADALYLLGVLSSNQGGVIRQHL
jgi:hypothetical protein